ncbi:hypothetical protein LEP1GSC039_3948 [Leptospira santarosai str. 2000027870]|nr:hypothetical protein LEP1GSC039_3948 [Leptospira santarosai str. 2000027870]
MSILSKTAGNIIFYSEGWNIFNFKSHITCEGVLLTPLRPDVSVGFQSLEGKLSKDRGVSLV